MFQVTHIKSIIVLQSPVDKDTGLGPAPACAAPALRPCRCLGIGGESHGEQLFPISLLLLPGRASVAQVSDASLQMLHVRLELFHSSTSIGTPGNGLLGHEDVQAIAVAGKSKSKR